MSAVHRKGSGQSAAFIDIDVDGGIIIRNASGESVTLPPGSADQVLTIVSGVPAWQAASGGSGDQLDPGVVYGLSQFNQLL